MIDSFVIPDVLTNLVQTSGQNSESSVLEYKVLPHDLRNQPCEFFKDILGLLNSYERPDEDRFLIYGIENKHRKAVGYKFGEAFDDAQYQTFFKKISPRPQIEFHTIDAAQILPLETGTKEFACFYIPSSNFGSVYELNESVRDSNEASENKRKRYEAGTAFVREGSQTRPLMQDDREKILSIKRQSSGFEFSKFSALLDSVSLKTLIAAAVAGAWDENNERDKEFLSEVSGLSYLSFESRLKELNLRHPNFMRYLRGTWTVVDRVNALEGINQLFSGGELERLKPLIKEVFSSSRSQYELDLGIRFDSGLREEVLENSDELKQGVAEFLAIVGTATVELPTVKMNDLDRFICDSSSYAILADDWRVLVSVSCTFPFLAEASPSAFLSLVSRAINEGAMLDFLGRASNGIAGMPYGHEVFTGIRFAARLEENFSKALSLLVELKDVSHYSADTIVGILLPWLPQSPVGIATQVSVGKYLIENDCWDVLIRLLPGETLSSLAICEPVYLSVDPLPEGINQANYWEVSRSYVRAAIESAKTNHKHAMDLISHMNAIKLSGLLAEFLGMLGDTYLERDIQARFEVWSNLKCFLNKCEKFDNEIWDLGDDDKRALEHVIARLEPQSEFYQALFWFIFADIDYREAGNYEESSRRLLESRIVSIEALYDRDGWAGILQLARNAKSEDAVGSCCAQTKFAKSEIANLKKLLKPKNGLVRFAKSYIYQAYLTIGSDVLSVLKGEGWGGKATSRFLSALPCTKEVWDIAEKLPKEHKKYFWKHAYFFPYGIDFDQRNRILDAFSKVGRAKEGIELCAACVDKGLDFDSEKAIKCIEQLSSGNVDTMTRYYFSKVCSLLEEKMPCDELAREEFRLFPLLDEPKSSYLIKRMSSSHDFFCEILTFLYGREDDLSTFTDEQRKILASRAFEVLNSWQLPPGTQEEGTFDSQKFDTWLEGTMLVAEEKGLAEAAQHHIGACLFHSPADTEGLFIDKHIASCLNEHPIMLDGYHSESINSRGCFNLDGTGEPYFSFAEDFTNKARELEKQGLLLFASKLREISNACIRQAEDEIERHA